MIVDEKTPLLASTSGLALKRSAYPRLGIWNGTDIRLTPCDSDGRRCPRPRLMGTSDPRSRVSMASSLLQTLARGSGDGAGVCLGMTKGCFMGIAAHPGKM